MRENEMDEMDKMDEIEELKVGTITWFDSDSGAFIEDLANDNAPRSPIVQSSMPTRDQIFVSSELLRQKNMLSLQTGDLVRYTENNKIATNIEQISLSKTTKSFRSRF
jgi:hypothetical protein